MKSKALLIGLRSPCITNKLCSMIKHQILIKVNDSSITCYIRDRIYLQQG